MTAGLARDAAAAAAAASSAGGAPGPSASAPGARTLTGGPARHAAMDRATAGAPAELPYRGELERSFGADFSGVGAHLGQADALDGLDAVAAARGERVAFASGAPSRELVAHELAHVVQHRRGGRDPLLAAFGGLDDAASDAAAEREADAAAGAVAAGELASGAMAAGSARAAGGVHLAKDPPPAAPLPAPLLPPKRTIVLGGDLFELELSCTGPDDARVFGADLRYAGEHPATTRPASPASTVKLRKRLAQRLAVKAKILTPSDREVIIDVFDNQFDLFRIEDVVGFDATARARTHDFTARMYGVAGRGSILVRDSKAGPRRAPATAAAQGDTPGEYPETFDTGDTGATGGAARESWELRFDADGDGHKE